MIFPESAERLQASSLVFQGTEAPGFFAGLFTPPVEHWFAFTWRRQRLFGVLQIYPPHGCGVSRSFGFLNLSCHPGHELLRVGLRENRSKLYLWNVLSLHSPKIKPTNPGNKCYERYEVTTEMWPKPFKYILGHQALSDFAGSFFSLGCSLAKMPRVKLSRCTVIDYCMLLFKVILITFYHL